MKTKYGARLIPRLFPVLEIAVTNISPLGIGCDVRDMDKDTGALLTNREVLAVNQDPLRIPARRLRQTGPSELWMKPLVERETAVALLNRGLSGNDITLKVGDIGCLDTSKQVRGL